MADSDSDIEYSDALDSPLDVDLASLDVNKDEFEDAKTSSKDQRDTDDDEESDQPEDPLKKRKDMEELMSNEEKEELRLKARSLKEEGNQLYLSGTNDEAAAKYTEALDICPLTFSEDRAILFANRAAVHIKTDNKKEAIEDCSKAIELKPDYVKALLRRGQTFESSDQPHDALKDFERALEIDPGLKEARVAVMRLPDKIRDKDERLKAEMLENLKSLGNMVLKPFGLSTNNFNMVQDPTTGGYSINFNK